MGERVLVCGGRDYNDYHRLNAVLCKLWEVEPFSVFMQGGAGGADYLARKWASSWCGAIQKLTFQADWCAHGKAAGPIRNQRMIDEGKPDLVVAFPGGRGTADMVRRAKAAGLRVIEIGNHDHG